MLRYESPFIVSELRSALELIMRVVQHENFVDEISRVEANDPCKRISALRLIYFDGVLRVGRIL